MAYILREETLKINDIFPSQEAWGKKQQITPKKNRKKAMIMINAENSDI